MNKREQVIKFYQNWIDACIIKDGKFYMYYDDIAHEWIKVSYHEMLSTYRLYKNCEPPHKEIF